MNEGSGELRVSKTLSCALLHSRGSLQSTYEERLERILTFGPLDQKWRITLYENKMCGRVSVFVIK